MDAKQEAERAVARSGGTLVGGTVGPFRIDSIFHYGAVDIDPRHLVVWVLLSGGSDDSLPEWYFGEDDADGHAQADRLGPEVVTALAEVQAVVRRELRAVGWPDADHAQVGFDSSHRVEVHGRWSYFK